MSRRTAKAATAVREAWEKERQLVLEGKGTRDWTPEQQHSIIDKGRAYDEDGKAFEGHHMRSVEANPEHQGESENIQFLTRTEHLEAHGGSFRNPTNGFYDYRTGETRDFGDGPFQPCEVITLSDPVVTAVNTLENNAQRDDSADEAKAATPAPEHEVVNHESDDAASRPRPAKRVHKKQSFVAVVVDNAKRFGSFIGEHKETIRFVAENVVIPAFTATVVGVLSSNNSGGSSGSTAGKRTESPVNTAARTASTTSAKTGTAGANTTTLPPTNGTKRGTHASPIEHDVSGYTRVMNGKTIHVDSYRRGGKKT